MSALQPAFPGFDQHRIRVMGRLTVADIQTIVADFYRIPRAEMTSPNRKREVARPRQVAMYLARTIAGRSLNDIGARFGGRDHTTVLHGIRSVEANQRLFHDAQTLRIGLGE